MKAVDLDLLHLVLCTGQFIVIVISLSVTIYCKQHSRINSTTFPLVGEDPFPV